MSNRHTIFAVDKIQIKIKTMEVITMESQVFKELQSKINMIAKFVTAIENKQAEESIDPGGQLRDLYISENKR
jgi:hypothetical protein